MDGQWMTYGEAGERWGCSPEAIRRRALRGHWARMPGNDGKTRVLIPEGAGELLALRSGTARVEGTAELLGQRSGAARADAPAMRDHLDTLKAENARLVAQLETAEARETAAEARSEAELAAERERSHGHRLDYERERDRADKLVTELTDMAAQVAENETLKMQLAAAEARADTLVAELATLALAKAMARDRAASVPTEPQRARSWWPWRRAG